MLEKLEKDYRMQKRITNAYQNLVDDLLVDQQVHKSRQQSHRKALKKVSLQKFQKMSEIGKYHYKLESKNWIALVVLYKKIFL